MITNKKARELAYSWHGGQSSPLYAFASSGIVVNLDALTGECAHCVYVCEGHAGGYTKADTVGAKALLEYVRSHRLIPAHYVGHNMCVNNIMTMLSNGFIAPWYTGKECAPRLLALNLDCMELSELEQFVDKYRNIPRPCARDYGVTSRDAQILVSYAFWKNGAMNYRLQGNIEKALKAEHQCDSLYCELSKSARELW